jgi:2-polyprenyl-3-methyl-5-hydroxy-6-metoxy-1,4-benzoquinol methylase
MITQEYIQESYNVSYDSKRRFVSYWHQIREVLDRNPKRVLEVGIGNGFVSKYLRNKDITVTTVDIEEALQPDVVADILQLPFPDASFDVVTAYEVLEHMPYEKSVMGLRELARVSSRWALISLPDASHAFRVAITIPRFGYIQKVFSAPALVLRKHPYAKSHEWELGIQRYPVSRIINDMRTVGFTITKSYRLYENPYHRFFILQKR